MPEIRFKRLGVALVGALVTAALVVGAAAFFSEANAAPGGCICPMVYSPVRCSNGKTYSNLCVANCNHATGCVPVFIVPPPDLIDRASRRVALATRRLNPSQPRREPCDT